MRSDEKRGGDQESVISLFFGLFLGVLVCGGVVRGKGGRVADFAGECRYRCYEKVIGKVGTCVLLWGFSGFGSV